MPQVLALGWGYATIDTSAIQMNNGGHTDMPDWPTFLKFAQKYIKTR